MHWMATEPGDFLQDFLLTLTNCVYASYACTPPMLALWAIMHASRSFSLHWRTVSSRFTTTSRKVEVEVRVRVRYVFLTIDDHGDHVFIPDSGSLDQSRLSDKSVCTIEHRSAAPVLVRTDDSIGSWRERQNSLKVGVRVHMPI